MSAEAGKVSADGAVFLFDSTHDAMKAEEIIVDAGFWCDVVPRPPDTASTLCGLAIQVLAADRQSVVELLAATGIAFEIYQLGAWL